MSPEGAHIWAPYCGVAPIPGEWLGRWNLDPVLLVGVAALFVWVWKSGPDSPARRRIVASALAITILVFVSPFCALSAALFSARVAHHLLLTVAIAPLLVFALPLERTRWPGSLLFWTAIQALCFWLWHAPDLYARALSSHSVYWLMQLTLAGTAAGFWAALRRSGEPAAVAALLTTTVQMGLLGALITFASVPIYEPHFLTTFPWGFSALEDQQIAGLIMWAPAAALYLAAALFIAGRWLAREERKPIR
ncbi:MAG TPA: cytochrome c oxidase assembly protein [Allosphingosinicella sp.]|nr:cytochrome c oxidase assembly protein [Allosphingosinicella sp.]